MISSTDGPDNTDVNGAVGAAEPALKDTSDARTQGTEVADEEEEDVPSEDSIREAEVAQALQAQDHLIELLDRIEAVQAEHEKLTGEKNFLEDYIGNLVSMQQTSIRR